MHVKASLRPADKERLSPHEIKRCRAVARGRHWEVWEEDILWWSLDRTRWQPLEAEILMHRRRWLTVETEEGTQAALVWDVKPSPELPPVSADREALPEPQRL